MRGDVDTDASLARHGIATSTGIPTLAIGVAADESVIGIAELIDQLRPSSQPARALPMTTPARKRRGDSPAAPS